MVGDLVWWTETILLERMVKIILEGHHIETHPVEAGIPQG
jgi:hypothetical protein